MSNVEERFQAFYNGSLEAVYKICPVMGRKGTDECMYDRGWELTKSAKQKWSMFIRKWYDKYYGAMFELINATKGIDWEQLGTLFVCSMTGQGTGLWDIPNVGTRGKQLNKVAKEFYNGEINLYIRSGKYCDFETPRF